MVKKERVPCACDCNCGCSQDVSAESCWLCSRGLHANRAIRAKHQRIGAAAEAMRTAGR